VVANVAKFDTQLEATQFSHIAATVPIASTSPAAPLACLSGFPQMPSG